MPELFAGSAMNEGWVSNRLGIKGVPGSAEEIMVARDIMLAELTGGRVHLAHVTTAGTVEMGRHAKQRGLNVTCEVTPHHLTLSEEAVLGYHSGESAFAPLTLQAYDTNAKVNPPLRSRADTDALVAGLAEGVIDFIATDHAPHTRVDKLCTFDDAALGISALETALGSVMSLVHDGRVPLPLLVERLTAAPARFLGRDDLGTLRTAAPADITVFDPEAEWVVDVASFKSKGKNSPLDGVTLKGRVMATVVGGEVVFSHSNVDV